MSLALEIALSIADAAKLLGQPYDPFEISKAAKEIYARHSCSEYSVDDIAETLKEQVATFAA